LGEGLTNIRHKKPVCYEMLRSTAEEVCSEHSNETEGSMKCG